MKKKQIDWSNCRAANLQYFHLYFLSLCCSCLCVLDESIVSIALILIFFLYSLFFLFIVLFIVLFTYSKHTIFVTAYSVNIDLNIYGRGDTQQRISLVLVLFLVEMFCNICIIIFFWINRVSYLNSFSTHLERRYNLLFLGS